MVIKLYTKANVCLSFCFALVGEACLFSPALVYFSPALVYLKKYNYMKIYNINSQCSVLERQQAWCLTHFKVHLTLYACQVLKLKFQLYQYKYTYISFYGVNDIRDTTGNPLYKFSDELYK